MKSVRVALLQRVCTAYRRNLFQKMSEQPGVTIRLFIGEDLPDSKVCSTTNLSGVDFCRLNTRFFKLMGRWLPYHNGLRKALEDFDPDVILCEGESNFLNYLQAFWYRRSHPGVRIVHWSLGGLPGKDFGPRSFSSRFKCFFQKGFDAFIVYSSFGRDCLVRLGHDPSKIHIAVNVADTTEHMRKACALKDTPTEARRRLGLPDRFTVIYCGTLDANKRPDDLLDIAARNSVPECNYVLIGSGPLLEPLRERAQREGLSNVYLPGRVSEDLPFYYRAGSVMVLPGRGGMVISEAMAWALPVVVHEADGTEYDLVEDGQTGVRIKRSDELAGALRKLAIDPEYAQRMGIAGRLALEKSYTAEHMLASIMEALNSLFRVKSA
jgi:glycosyltransferase involved in cell wall biosynthesis